MLRIYKLADAPKAKKAPRVEATEEDVAATRLQGPYRAHQAKKRVEGLRTPTPSKAPPIFASPKSAETPAAAETAAE